jgi:hypothetical protein
VHLWVHGGEYGQLHNGKIDLPVCIREGELEGHPDPMIKAARVVLRGIHTSGPGSSAGVSAVRAPEGRECAVEAECEQRAETPNKCK